MKNQTEYKTKDLGEAAALLCSNVKLLRLDKASHFFWFVFNDLSRCEEVSNQYWFGSLMINAKHYQDAIKTLKDRLFTRV